MKDSPRYAALELAVNFAGPRQGITAEDVVGAATVFANFLTEGVAPAADTPTPPAKPAKATPVKAADKPAAEPKAETPAETPAPKQEAKPDPKPAAKTAPEVTAADCSKAVVKLVTKIGRDPAVQWMQKTFNSPNVSGLDLTKHTYPAVIAKIQAHIAELEKPAETETSPAD